MLTRYHIESQTGDGLVLEPTSHGEWIKAAEVEALQEEVAELRVRRKVEPVYGSFAHIEQLEQRLAEAEQRVKTHLSAFEEEAARADKAEQQVKRLHGVADAATTLMRNAEQCTPEGMPYRFQGQDIERLLATLAEGRDE